MENNQPIYNNLNIQLSQPQGQKNGIKIAVFLLVAVILILAIVFFVSYWIKLRSEKSDKTALTAQNQEIQSNVLTLNEDFPFFRGPANVYFDQEDKNILWISFSGAIIKYNLEKDTFETVLKGANGLDNSPYSFLKKGDDIFFSLFQGGFERVNIKNGNRKIYTMADGLANNANIQIINDPYADYIWIATFEGLSRFDYKNETFNNFKSQLGFMLEIDDMVVDKEYVWAVISANAYSPGGVVRLNKNLAVWKYWGPKDFDKNSSRVDILGGMDAINGRAIIEVNTTGNRAGSKIMEYSPDSGVWKELSVANNKSYNNFTYFGNKIFFIKSDYGDNRVYYLDRSKDKIVPDAYVIPGAHISRDSSGERLAIVDWPDKIVVVDPRASNYKVLKLNQKDIFLTKLIGVEDNNLIFTNGRQVIIHNFSDESNRVIDSLEMVSDRFEGKILGDYLVLVADGGETMVGCGVGKFVLINLKTGLTEKRLDIPDCFDSIMFGKDISEIYIGVTSYETKEIVSVKKYVEKTNKFEGQELAFINLDNMRAISRSSSYQAESSNGTIVKYLYDFQDKDRQTAKFQISKAEKTFDKVITFNSNLLDGFNSPINLEINSMVFDKKDPNKLLVGTSFGLIIYDVEADKDYKITTKDGLISNKIQKIVSLKDSIIITDNTGAYIYKIDYSKLK